MNACEKYGFSQVLNTNEIQMLDTEEPNFSYLVWQSMFGVRRQISFLCEYISHKLFVSALTENF